MPIPTCTLVTSTFQIPFRTCLWAHCSLDNLSHVWFRGYLFSYLNTQTHFPILIFQTQNFPITLLAVYVWMEILNRYFSSKTQLSAKLWDPRKLLLCKMHRTATLSTCIDTLSPLQTLFTHLHLFKQNLIKFIILHLSFSALLSLPLFLRPSLSHCRSIPLSLFS